MSLIAHLNSINLSDGVADGNGSLWYLEDMTGWDSPPVRNQILELPAQHGGVTTEGLYGPRQITVSGVCKAVSEAAFYTSRDYLMSQTNYLNRWTTGTMVFSVEEGAVHRRVTCLRSSEVRTRMVGSNAFRFEVQLRADDPFKYSNTQNSEAFVASVPEVIANAGNARTYPTITLNATGTPTITCGPLTWTASASIPSGTVIDMKARTLLNGATDHFDKFNLTSEWIYMEPGNNTVESNVAMTVQWRSAWV